MQDTLDTKQVSKTARKIILMVHGDYKDTTLYITITNKEKREITGTLVVEDEPNLSSGARYYSQKFPHSKVLAFHWQLPSSTLLS